METLSLPRQLALTHALDTIRYVIFRLAYAARGTLIRWCLAFANFLERGQAHGITRAASAKGWGPPAGVTIPPPTFPSPDRRHGRFFAHSDAPIISVSESELRYEDFDDVQTAVYRAAPTLESRPMGAHRRPPAVEGSSRKVQCASHQSDGTSKASLIDEE
jgi:hypothetical protein